MMKQTGFSLIEAMVALVVLSVGMIGIAAMYGQGLSASRTAQFRTQAVNLAADMADRIRVNRLGSSAYGGAPDGTNNCGPGGIVCTPAQMAAYDLFLWKAQVEQLLPNGEMSIVVNAATLPPTYTIELTWDEPGQAERSEHQVDIQVPNI